MKKIFASIFLGITVMGFSQQTTIDDALGLAVDNLTGSARFRGMSGAFGAVGGDLSSININPAGSIFFNHNVATITGSILTLNNNSNYFGKNTSSSDGTFDLNQVGAVFVFEDRNPKSDWKKIAFGLNYDNSNNYLNSIFSSGTNPNNSIGNYFLNFAQGNVPLNILNSVNYYDMSFSQQQAFLGYDTYIFEPSSSSSSNTSYYTNIPTGGNYYQENKISTTGYNGKLSGNFSTIYKDIISLGINLNAHFVNIRKNFSVYESNSNTPYNTGSTISEIIFDNQLYTTGNGFSFNLGTIIKVSKEFRLGLAYESPTWYRLTDELTQGVKTNSLNNPDNNPFPSSYHDPIVYLPYTIQTPGKWTGSLAYIHGKRGLLSVDVSSKDYTQTKFKPTGDYSNENNIISNSLKTAYELRIGGEYKIKKVSLRAGYRYEQSPYIDTQVYGNLFGYSGGVGYNFGESRIDVAYSHDQRDFAQALLSSGITDTALINRKNNNVTISYTINF